MNFEVVIRKLTDWKEVLNSARTTVGKADINKEPSKRFKQSILIAEHSPIRNLMFSIEIENIPYFVAMHLRTHHIGFKSGDDDIVYVETSRSDRKGHDRDALSQTAPVNLKMTCNAQSLINVSRVRLCRQASPETRKVWKRVISVLSTIEPELAACCVPNCVYRGFCPEIGNQCGWIKTAAYKRQKVQYEDFIDDAIFER